MGEEKANYETFDLVGNRRRIFEGNAAFGYSPQSALADLIDNSIGANASVIRIETLKKKGKIEVRISDDGDGMSPEKLKEAMAPGAKSELANHKLSKFGFGMKTASMEMSKSGFTVFTRSLDKEESAAALMLEDQDGDGFLQGRFYAGAQISPTYREYLNKTSENDSGTVVIWHDANLKEADHFKIEKGDQEAMLRRVQNRIVPHLGMVFHRWLSGDNEDGRKVKIIYGKDLIEPWNPFDQEWADTEKSAPIADFDVRAGGGSYGMKFKAHVLRKDIPTRAKDHPSRKNSANQGIYVYRMDRVIAGPAWFGLSPSGNRAPLNGLRFAVDMPTELDTVMMLDVKKSNIDFPQDVLDYFEPIVARYINIEENDYKSKQKGKNKQNTPLDALRRADNAAQALEKVDPFLKPDRQSNTEVIVTAEDGLQFPLRARLHPSATPDSTIEVVDAHVTGGQLWESLTTASGALVVRVNQEHDFYQKVILPASTEAQAGYFQIFLAFSRAEFRTHHSDFKLQWEHARQHVSQTLNYFAEELELPELEGD
jgi:hypothetical protein